MVDCGTITSTVDAAKGLVKYSETSTYDEVRTWIRSVVIQYNRSCVQEYRTVQPIPTENNLLQQNRTVVD